MTSSIFNSGLSPGIGSSEWLPVHEASRKGPVHGMSYLREARQPAGVGILGQHLKDIF